MFLFSCFISGLHFHHHNISECDPTPEINEIKEVYNRKISQFFPQELHYVNKPSKFLRRNPSTGWADKRDHELCKMLLSNETIYFNMTKLIYT